MRLPLDHHSEDQVPNGFLEDGTPSAMTFVGKLHAETEILALAKYYQDATDFHLRYPDLDGQPALCIGSRHEGPKAPALTRRATEVPASVL